MSFLKLFYVSHKLTYLLHYNLSLSSSKKYLSPPPPPLYADRGSLEVLEFLGGEKGLRVKKKKKGKYEAGISRGRGVQTKTSMEGVLDIFWSKIFCKGPYDTQKLPLIVTVSVLELLKTEDSHIVYCYLSNCKIRMKLKRADLMTSILTSRTCLL